MRIGSGEPVVIEQPWGGLGDNLQFSTLPEMFSGLGHPVYISSRNAVRNDEIHALVWGRNPFVRGISDAPANAGACLAGVFDGGLPRATDFIGRIEAAHGLVPRHLVPRVYYEPALRPELKDAILVDLGSTSVAGSAGQLADYRQFVFDQFHYDPAQAFQVLFRRSVASRNGERLQSLAGLPARDIFEYCDLISSCRALVTVHSGAHALAVAIRGERAGPAIHCLASVRQFNWRNYIFPRVEYFIV